MKKKFVIVALLGMVPALGGQPAVAGTHHVTAKTERHVMSERARNANAYLPPRVVTPSVVTYPAAEAPYFPDEALSPPAGH
jgi:hypothetical protein